MKLIIEIPELDYECAKQRWMRGNDAHKMDYYISKGIPLDSIKAKIIGIPSYKFNVYELESIVLDILDNIGKAESGDKE